MAVQVKNFTHKEKILFFVIFFSLSVLSYFYMFRTYMFDYDVSYGDLKGQRIVCAYTLNGFDAYSFRGIETEAAPGLGVVGDGFHATPWGSLLGNVFYSGFLPSFEQSKIYYFIVSFIMLLMASYFFSREFEKISKEFMLIAFFVSITSLDFLVSVHMGNAGCDICALILISWAVCDEHPYISGILMGFAMIKPQTALLFCLTMLFMKKFIPLIVAAVIDIAAWLCTSILVNKGMFELLKEFFMSPDSQAMPHAGIFSLLSENQYIAMIMSMILGIAFVLMILKFLPKKVPDYFKIYPACIATNFWCYMNITEGYVLILPTVICLWIMANSQRKLERLFWLCCSIYCCFGIAIKSIIRRFLCFILTIDKLNLISIQLPKTLYEVGFILLGILMAFELRKIYKEAE